MVYIQYITFNKIRHSTLDNLHLWYLCKRYRFYLWFYNFSVIFWNCSDSVEYFCFSFFLHLWMGKLSVSMP